MWGSPLSAVSTLSTIARRPGGVRWWLDESIARCASIATGDSFLGGDADSSGDGDAEQRSGGVRGSLLAVARSNENPQGSSGSGREAPPEQQAVPRRGKEAHAFVAPAAATQAARSAGPSPATTPSSRSVPRGEQISDDEGTVRGSRAPNGRKGILTGDGGSGGDDHWDENLGGDAGDDDNEAALFREPGEEHRAPRRSGGGDSSLAGGDDEAWLEEVLRAPSTSTSVPSLLACMDADTNADTGTKLLCEDSHVDGHGDGGGGAPRRDAADSEVIALAPPTAMRNAQEAAAISASDETADAPTFPKAKWREVHAGVSVSPGEKVPGRHPFASGQRPRRPRLLRVTGDADTDLPLSEAGNAVRTDLDRGDRTRDNSSLDVAVPNDLTPLPAPSASLAGATQAWTTATPCDHLAGNEFGGTRPASTARQTPVARPCLPAHAKAFVRDEGASDFAPRDGAAEEDGSGVGRAYGAGGGAGGDYGIIFGGGIEVGDETVGWRDGRLEHSTGRQLPLPPHENGRRRAPQSAWQPWVREQRLSPPQRRVIFALPTVGGPDYGSPERNPSRGSVSPSTGRLYDDDRTGQHNQLRAAESLDRNSNDEGEGGAGGGASPVEGGAGSTLERQQAALSAMAATIRARRLARLRRPEA